MCRTVHVYVVLRIQTVYVSVGCSWLEKKLAAVNRTETPWLIVNWHIPMYSTDP